MEKDPICGMTVNPDHVQARAQYQNRVYFFCSPACREAFDQSPDSYT